MEYPIRINKYLAEKNITTRRGADALIEKGDVFINGKVAKLGDKVNKEDKVEVKEKNTKEKYVYYAYNKPTGIETPDISVKGVFPVGRLDKNSHGLIILTNDGRITDKLLNPKYVHEKEYVVKTSKKLRSNFKTKMEQGVNIEGYVTRPCKVRIINDNTFRIILSEGKKHQIRRMCSALFQEVLDLKRVRILNIELGKIKEGQTRTIKGEELNAFLKKIFS